MTAPKAGDTVRCLVGHYKSYAYGEKATVKRVEETTAGNIVIILDNDLCDEGTSMYLIQNWAFVTRPPKKKTKQLVAEPKKEHQIMGYEKTKYFAKRLDTSTNYEGHLHFLTNGSSPLMNTQNDVLDWVKENIVEGEKWVILQTMALVEPKAPITPVQVTVYR